MLAALESNPASTISGIKAIQYSVQLGDLNHFVENIGQAQGAESSATFYVSFSADDFRNQYGDLAELKDYEYGVNFIIYRGTTNRGPYVFYSGNAPASALRNGVVYAGSSPILEILQENVALSSFLVKAADALQSSSQDEDHLSAATLARIRYVDTLMTKVQQQVKAINSKGAYDSSRNVVSSFRSFHSAPDTFRPAAESVFTEFTPKTAAAFYSQTAAEVVSHTGQRYYAHFPVNFFKSGEMINSYFQYTPAGNGLYKKHSRRFETLAPGYSGPMPWFIQVGDAVYGKDRFRNDVAAVMSRLSKYGPAVATDVRTVEPLQFVPFAQWRQKALEEVDRELFYLKDKASKTEAKYWLNPSATEKEKYRRDLSNLRQLRDLLESAASSSSQEFLSSVLRQSLNSKDASQEDRDLLAKVVSGRNLVSDPAGLSCLLFESNLVLQKGWAAGLEANSKGGQGCANAVVVALLDQYRGQKGGNVPYSDADFSNRLVYWAHLAQGDFSGSVPLKVGPIQATAYGKQELLAVAFDIHNRLLQRYGNGQRLFVAQYSLDEDGRQGLRLVRACRDETGSLHALNQLRRYHLQLIKYDLSSEGFTRVDESDPLAIARKEVQAGGLYAVLPSMASRLALNCLWDDSNYVEDPLPAIPGGNPEMPERTALHDVLARLQRQAQAAGVQPGDFRQDLLDTVRSRQSSLSQDARRQSLHGTKYAEEDLVVLDYVLLQNFMRAATSLQGNAQVIGPIYDQSLDQLSALDSDVNVKIQRMRVQMDAQANAPAPFSSSLTLEQKYALAERLLYGNDKFFERYGKNLQLFDLLSSTGGQVQAAKICVTGVVTSIVNLESAAFIAGTAAVHGTLSLIPNKPLGVAIGAVADLSLALYFTYHGTSALLADYSKMDVGGQISNTCAVGANYAFGAGGIWHGTKTAVKAARDLQAQIGAKKGGDPVIPDSSAPASKSELIGEQPALVSVGEAILKAEGEPVLVGAKRIQGDLELSLSSQALHSLQKDARSTFLEVFSKLDEMPADEALGKLPPKEVKARLVERQGQLLDVLEKQLGWVNPTTRPKIKQVLAKMAGDFIDAFATSKDGTIIPEKAAQVDLLMNKVTTMAAYQDHITVGQRFSDHSIQHLMEDSAKALTGTNNLNGPVLSLLSPQDAALVQLVALTHDIGYTEIAVNGNPISRLSKNHPHYSRSFYESKGMASLLEQIVGPQKAAETLYAIGSHGAKKSTKQGSLVIEKLGYSPAELQSHPMPSLFALADDFAVQKVPEFVQVLAAEIVDLFRLGQEKGKLNEVIYNTRDPARRFGNLPAADVALFDQLKQARAKGDKALEADLTKRLTERGYDLKNTGIGSYAYQSDSVVALKKRMRDSVGQLENKYSKETLRQVLYLIDSLITDDFKFVLSPAVVHGTEFKVVPGATPHIDATITISKPFFDLFQQKMGLAPKDIYAQATKVGEDFLLRSDLDRPITDAEFKPIIAEIQTQLAAVNQPGFTPVSKSFPAQSGRTVTVKTMSDGRVVADSGNGNTVTFTYDSGVTPAYEGLFNKLSALPATPAKAPVSAGSGAATR